MGRVADGTSHGKGGMNILFGEHRFVVAGGADIGLVGDEKLWRVLRMRVVAARAADTHFQCLVEHRSFY